MEWLSAWLKKIILLVLLAAFLDLILPNTNLQRYVKMVMGLIILLAILSPVFALFHLSQDELAYKLGQYQESFQNKSQAEWQPLAKKLLSHQEKQAEAYVKQEMARTIRQQLKATYGTEPDQVEVSLDKRDDQPVIKEITITYAEGESTNRTVQVVKPIEPVRIETGKENRPPTSVDSAKNEGDPNDRKLKEWLAQNWQLPTDQIHVIRSSQTAEER